MPLKFDNKKQYIFDRDKLFKLKGQSTLKEMEKLTGVNIHTLDGILHKRQTGVNMNTLMAICDAYNFDNPREILKTI